MKKTKLAIFISILGICAIGMLIYFVFFASGASRELRTVFDALGPYECVFRDNPYTPNEYQAIDNPEKIEEIISLLINNVSHSFDEEILDIVKNRLIGEEFRITFISNDGKTSIDITGYYSPETFMTVSIWDSVNISSTGYRYYTRSRIGDRIRSIMETGKRMLVQRDDLEKERFSKLTLNENPLVTMCVETDTLTNEGCRVVVKNEDESEARFGNTFHVEEWTGEQWERHDAKYSLGYIVDWYYVREGESLSFDIDWRRVYVTLPQGKYRLVKKYWQDGEERWVKAEFEL